MVGLSSSSASNEFYSAAEVPHRLIHDAQGTAHDVQYSIRAVELQQYLPACFRIRSDLSRMRTFRKLYQALPFAAQRLRIKRWLAARSGLARWLVLAAQQDAAHELEQAVHAPSALPIIDDATRVLSRPHAGGRGVGHVAQSPAVLPTPAPVRLVAFYLPQFHPAANRTL